MAKNTQLAKSLSLFPVVFVGLAWMTPMIYFTIYGVAFQASGGMLVNSYLIAFLAIFFTAYSYSQMVKAYPIAGSAYTFTKQSINPTIGYLVGWALLLDYLFSPIIACLTFGIFMNAQFPSIPIAVWILLLNVVLAVVNIVGIKSVARISGFSVIFQVLFILIFCLLIMKDLIHGGSGAGLLSFKPFFRPNMSLSTVFSGAALICFSFLGFDAVTTMAEETIQPKKTIPKAIFLIVIIAAVLYLTVSYFIQVAYPDFTFKNPDTASYQLVKLVGGNLLSSFFITVLIVAIFTQGVSSVTSISRFLYALGRESVLPNKFFGYVHPRFHTPVMNILFVAVISLAALFIDLNTSVTFVSFGSLTAFTFVNLSVIGHYFIKEGKRSLSQTFLYLIFPLIGAGFIGWLLTLLKQETLIAGAIWLSCGFIYLLYITKMFKVPIYKLGEKTEIA